MSSPIAEHAYHPGLLSAERRTRNLEQWRRHSRQVRLLRRVLPALIVLLVLMLGGWAGVSAWMLRNSGLGHTANMAIRMVNPKFIGRDQGGRPFQLSAGLAVRDANTPQQIYLQAPVAVLGATPADQTEASSGRGVYREDTRILVMDDNVHLRNSQNDFTSAHAVVNTLTNQVDGQSHIDGVGSFGKIAADGYSVQNNGAHVYFNGHVKAHIIQGGVNGGALKGPR